MALTIEQLSTLYHYANNVDRRIAKKLLKEYGMPSKTTDLDRILSEIPKHPKKDKILAAAEVMQRDYDQQVYKVQQAKFERKHRVGVLKAVEKKTYHHLCIVFADAENTAMKAVLEHAKSQRQAEAFERWTTPTNELAVKHFASFAAEKDFDSTNYENIEQHLIKAWQHAIIESAHENCRAKTEPCARFLVKIYRRDGKRLNTMCRNHILEFENRQIAIDWLAMFGLEGSEYDGEVIDQEES